MKKMMKFAAGFMSAVMLMSSVSVFAADESAESAETADTVEAVSPFTDVNVDTQTGKNILKLYNTGVIAGYEDGTFRPDGNITRAELVRIFNQVFKYTPTEEQLANVSDFLDNTDPEAWFYNDVRIAQIAGYINGFEDNTFRGKENFTRQQACVVIDLITGVNTADPELVVEDEVSEWAVNYVNWALTAGLFPLEEGNTFRATKNITRAEVCNLLEIFVEEPAESGSDADVEENNEEEKEVTVQTSNGTVVKVKKGGSGGGGGSSRSSSGSGSSGSSGSTSSSNTDTTSASAETATEATTASASGSDAKATTAAAETQTETTTAASSSGSGSGSEAKTSETTKVTEAPTETTTEVVVNNVSDMSDDVLFSLENIYLSLQKYVVPNSSTSAEREVAEMIRNAMYKKINDHSYDIGSAVDEAIEKYHALSSEEKTHFKNNIISYCSINDLYNLQETFFPGLI